MSLKAFNQLLQQAISFHKAGHYNQAQARYHQALAIQPQNGQLLRLYGLSFYQQGYLNKAITWYRRAIKAQPNNPETWRNLGMALKDQTKYEEAIEAYQTAITWRRDYAEAFRNLGNVFIEQNRIEEAIVAYQEALRLKPHYAEAHTNLGTVLQKQKKYDEAIKAHEKAIELLPQWAPAHNNSGRVLLEQGQFVNASTAFRQAVELNDKYAIGWSNLGVALSALFNLQEAEEALSRGCQLDPQNPECKINLGIFLQQIGKYDEALVICEQLMALNSKKIEPYFNIASIYNASGKIELALQALRKAVSVAPNDQNAQFALSLNLLQHGYYEEGFAQYEWRRKSENHPKRCYEQPEWQGEDLRGKSIFLHPEQGLGDMLQFVRFAALLQEKGARVQLETYSVLRKIISDSFPQLDIISSADEVTPFDYHAPLMSIPTKLKLSRDDISTISNKPYLTALPEKIAQWRRWFKADKFNIGIVWQGNPSGAIDRGRSIPLRCFEPLTRLNGVQLISLQKNFGLDRLDELSTLFNIQQLPKEFDDGPDAFLDTVAVMKCLDLIVTSDTSVAHIGGASGCPTWLVLKHDPDWRWEKKEETSVWYPSMRLFRQLKAGDWSAPFAKIVEEIQRLYL